MGAMIRPIGPKTSRFRTWPSARLAAEPRSSERGCARDQEQPRPDDDGSDGSRDALTGRCETFDGDGCHHDSHRAQRVRVSLKAAMKMPNAACSRRQKRPPYEENRFFKAAVKPSRLG